MQRAKRANDLVAWVNNILNTNDVRTLDDLKSGVHLVQIIHSLDPDGFDLARVDFRASNDYYYARNLKLLQDVMQSLTIQILFKLEGVMQGEKRNELYGLVSYLKLHYATLKERINSRAALTYDPVVQRKRAQEKRNARHRPFRVAGISTAVTPAVASTAVAARPTSAVQSTVVSRHDAARSLRAFSDVGTVVSDTSQACTTVSTKQNHTRMKLRREELERWAHTVNAPIIRRLSSIGSLLDRSGAQTPLRGGGQGGGSGGGPSTRSPLAPLLSTAGDAAAAAAAASGGGCRPSTSPVMSSRQSTAYGVPAPPSTTGGGTSCTSYCWAPVCTAVNFEAIDLCGGDLSCPSLWPSGPGRMERDVRDPSCVPERAGSPTKSQGGNGGIGGRSPTRAGAKPSWSAFDAALAEFRRAAATNFAAYNNVGGDAAAADDAA